MEKEIKKTAFKTCRNKERGTYKVEEFLFAVATEVLRDEGSISGDYEGKSLIMAYDYRDANK